MAASSDAHTIITAAGVRMPRLIYGTAWKKERTVDLVVKAVLAGFRGIDTACQPKHYREDLVGEAVAKLQSEHGIQRESLFLQTKFTSLNGQDLSKPIPYQRNVPLERQVRQSFNKSLENLRTNYVDSLVMHGPERTHEANMEIWRVFEEIHSSGKAKQLGLSNFYDPAELAKIYSEARVKPAVVQNRFYADTGYDAELRNYCDKNNIVYQSFWTLTASPHILRTSTVSDMAASRNITAEQLFFRFVMDLGIAPLTGTSSEAHMKQDLAVLDITPLNQSQIDSIKREMGLTV